MHSSYRDALYRLDGEMDPKKLAFMLERAHEMGDIMAFRANQRSRRSWSIRVHTHEWTVPVRPKEKACPACEHIERATIDRALGIGQSARSIIRRYAGLTRRAVQRDHDECLKAEPREDAA